MVGCADKKIYTVSPTPWMPFYYLCDSIDLHAALSNAFFFFFQSAKQIWGEVLWYLCLSTGYKVLMKYEVLGTSFIMHNYFFSKQSHAATSANNVISFLPAPLRWPPVIC